MRILILEDDTTSRIILNRMLSQFGEVVLATNGKEAIDAYFESCNQNKRFELICLDIMVPQIDGQEVLRIIRNKEKDLGFDNLKNRSQIVMITALNDIDNVLTSFNEQCEGYIIKPFNKEKIVTTMQKLGLLPSEIGQ